MADKEGNIRTTEIFWSKEDSDSGDNGLIPATGLKSDRNKRPMKIKKVMKGKNPKEIAAGGVGRKVMKPAVTKLSTQSRDVTQTSQEDSNGDRKASLKDLCLEDKKRVANLIKELARLGEEKETMSELLHNERELFEDKISEVMEQQSHILKEREAIEFQLAECQQLIEKYQKVIKEKEEALSQDQPIKKHRGVHFMSARPVLHQYTPENAKGVPTRTHYDQELEVERYSPIPKQHSNYNTDLANTRTKPQSYRNFPEALKSASTPTPESKPGGTIYIPKPPHREDDGDRPFTSLIDKLIDEERNKTSHSVQDREIQLGPLVNPKFTNLQKDGQHLQSLSTDFQPLASECATPSLYENGAIQGKVDLHGPLSAPLPHIEGQTAGLQGVVEGSQLSQHANSSITTAPIPDGLNDKEFLQQYRELTPDQRKQQLFVQKQALLQEQERLKKILNEQEHLLEMKQMQLRKQQDIQKERLNYFDRTGAFPPNYDYSELRAQPQNSGLVLDQGLMYPGVNGLGHGYAKQPFMPMQPPHVNRTVIPPQTMAYNHAGVPVMCATSTHPFNSGYMPGATAQGGQVGTSNYIANKENHNVSTSTRQTRSACTSPMPSNYPPSTVECGTSPLKSQPGGRARERQAFSQQAGGQSRVGSTQKEANDHRILTDYRDERASRLLDLVDEVESLHNRSSEPVDCLRPYLSASRKEKPRQQLSLDPFQDSLFGEDSDDLEDEPRLGLSGLRRREQAPDRHWQAQNGDSGRHRQARAVNGLGEGLVYRGDVGDRQQGWGGGRGQEWEMEQSSEDLEESQVLEDVFFIK